jgi:transcriptional antiterminator
VNTVERRLELLKLEGMGFNQVEIVKQLSQKHGCSDRTVYYDFENRANWQPTLQQLSDHEAILLKTVNRYEQIYREASIRLLTGTQELTQLGALNIMLKVNSKIYEVAVLPDILNRLKELEEKSGKRGTHLQPVAVHACISMSGCGD